MGQISNLYIFSQLEVLKTRDTVPKATLSKAKIVSYSCPGHDEASGEAKIEGFIPFSWESAVRLGTLKRWMRHPDIVGSVLWTPILKYRRYVDHPAIKSFLEQTMLPSIESCQLVSADGIRLRVDYLEPSETPPNKGGRPKTRGPAAVAAAGAGGAPDDVSASSSIEWTACMVGRQWEGFWFQRQLAGLIVLGEFPRI